MAPKKETPKQKRQRLALSAASAGQTDERQTVIDCMDVQPECVPRIMCQLKDLGFLTEQGELPEGLTKEKAVSGQRVQAWKDQSKRASVPKVEFCEDDLVPCTFDKCGVELLMHCLAECEPVSLSAAAIKGQLTKTQRKMPRDVPVHIMEFILGDMVWNPELTIKQWVEKCMEMNKQNGRRLEDISPSQRIGRSMGCIAARFTIRACG